jgi:hypothetical protein
MPGIFYFIVGIFYSGMNRYDLRRFKLGITHMIEAGTISVIGKIAVLIPDINQIGHHFMKSVGIG